MVSVQNELKMLGDINGKGTDREGKLTNKTTRPRRQEENMGEHEIPKEKCKSERNK